MRKAAPILRPNIIIPSPVPDVAGLLLMPSDLMPMLGRLSRLAEFARPDLFLPPRPALEWPHDRDGQTSCRFILPVGAGRLCLGFRHHRFLRQHLWRLL